LLSLRCLEGKETPKKRTNWRLSRADLRGGKVGRGYKLAHFGRSHEDSRGGKRVAYATEI